LNVDFGAMAAAKGRRFDAAQWGSKYRPSVQRIAGRGAARPRTSPRGGNCRTQHAPARSGEHLARARATTMSQLHLSEADPAASAGTTDDDAERLASSTAASTDAAVSRRLLSPNLREMGQTRATLIEPARSDMAGEEAQAGSERRIGARYLWQLAKTAAPLMAIDLFVLSIGILIARQTVILLGVGAGIDVSAHFLPIAIGFLLVAAELGLYPGIRLGPVEEFRRLSAAATAMFVMWAVGVAIQFHGLSNQPFFLVLTLMICVVGLPVGRGLARRVLARWQWWGFSTLVCGDDAVAVKVYHWLAANRRLGLRPVGVICDPSALEIGPDEPWFAGPWSAARDVAERQNVYWAVVVPPEGAAAEIGDCITEYLSTIPHIHVLSELTGLPDHWSRHQQLDGLTGIHLQQNLLLPLPRISKRLMDIAFTLAGGLVLLPLLFYIAVAVKFSSRGPVIYGHERIGRGGRRFKAWKFRTMFEDSSEVLEYYLEQHPELRVEWESDHKLKYDPRITRIGRFIRKTSLDELPQLWNVLRGEMSLVGPRPIVTAEIAKYGPYFGHYTMVKPGITGLWQVSGRNNTTYDERVQLDAYYVRNWSPWMDLYLLLRTVRIVLFAHGAY
jgi:Undecaprenyl-phosphate galactose phosphotransferase WbaP